MLIFQMLSISILRALSLYSFIVKYNQIDYIYTRIYTYMQ